MGLSPFEKPLAFEKYSGFLQGTLAFGMNAGF